MPCGEGIEVSCFMVETCVLVSRIVFSNNALLHENLCHDVFDDTFTKYFRIATCLRLCRHLIQEQKQVLKTLTLWDFWDLKGHRPLGLQRI
jgi:hypothetical protein